MRLMAATMVDAAAARAPAPIGRATRAAATAMTSADVDDEAPLNAPLQTRRVS